MVLRSDVQSVYKGPPQILYTGIDKLWLQRRRRPRASTLLTTLHHFFLPSCSREHNSLPSLPSTLYTGVWKGNGNSCSDTARGLTTSALERQRYRNDKGNPSSTPSKERLSFFLLQLHQRDCSDPKGKDD